MRWAGKEALARRRQAKPGSAALLDRDDEVGCMPFAPVDMGIGQPIEQRSA
jgi:hypothetical protein